MPLALPEMTRTEAGCNDSASGSLAADALRYISEADFAIVAGGEIPGTVRQGQLSFGDVASLFGGEIRAASVTVTAPELRTLLEELVGHVTVDMQTERIDEESSAFEGFPNISGFLLRYDPTAPVGERVMRITDPDGAELDLDDGETVYRLAGSTALLSGVYGGTEQEYVELPFSFSDALYTYLDRYGEDMKTLDWDRVTAVGVHAQDLVGRIGRPWLFVGILIPVLLMIWINRRRRT